MTQTINVVSDATFNGNVVIGGNEENPEPVPNNKRVKKLKDDEPKKIELKADDASIDCVSVNCTTINSSNINGETISVDTIEIKKGGSVEETDETDGKSIANVAYVNSHSGNYYAALVQSEPGPGAFNDGDYILLCVPKNSNKKRNNGFLSFICALYQKRTTHIG